MNKLAPLKPPASEVIGKFAAIIGDKYVVKDPAAKLSYEREWRDKYFGQSALVLRPGLAAEVAQLLKVACAEGIAVIPQGGNTGLVGGQTPFEHGGEVILSLERLNAIRSIDVAENAVTVEAGVPLQTLKDAVAQVNRFFPLSLGSQGSCQIGGNLSSNAGGVNVLNYGNMRDLCLGLEVVLADGRIWNGLRSLRKDNTGYDLKDLFIGAEGTLGIITAAVLKLFPLENDQSVSWCAVPSPQAGLDLLHLARQATTGAVTALELVPRIAVDFTVKHAGLRDPLNSHSPWYVLMQLSGPGHPGQLDKDTEIILAQAFENGLVSDAIIARSGDQAKDLWQIRERLSEVQKFEGGSIKHDVAVPISKTPDFIERAIAACLQLDPHCRPVPFGHLGDGNIHFNVSQPAGGERDAFLSRWEAFNQAVHDIVLSLDGSISAEHGIGRLKRDLMPQIKSPVELDLMHQLKSIFDPKGILNPGKLLP